MIDRGELNSIYNQTKSYQATATHFGVSKQRIHQIITGYSTLASRTLNGKRTKFKWGLSKLVFKLRQKPCIKCNEKMTAIHHLDKNHRNNTKENLIPVCGKCHGTYHRKIKTNIGID